MSPTGHNLAGVIVAAAGGYVISGSHDPLSGALWAGGAMLGTRAPDWMEMFRWVGGRRFSLIPHRTLTHWPPLWVAFSIAAALTLQGDGLLVATAALTTAWLHLLLDFATPSGIPLLQPFGKRYTARLYRSGDLIRETAALSTIAITAAVITLGIEST